MTVDYLIVGAGFAGCVAAERLASEGRTCHVIDRRNHIGGNSYDFINGAGHRVHKYGAHIFHTNSPTVFEYLSQFTAWTPYEHRVLSNVDGRLLPVPINLDTMAAFGGDEAAAYAAMIEPYTRKQWGDQWQELSADVFWRIRPRATRDDRYFLDRYQAMPRDGYTALFTRLLAHHNITYETNTSFVDVPRDTYREVIWSGPVDEFFGHVHGRLPYRSARFEFETRDYDQHQPVGVVNYPAEHIPYTRIVEFKHLTGQRTIDTTIAREYPCADGEPYWPVPTHATGVLYRRYQRLAAQTPGVHFIGRLGTYRYYDQHQVVGQAMVLAQMLLSGARHAYTGTQANDDGRW